MSARDDRHNAGVCGLCGKKRTLLQIRALTGAKDGEDVVRVVAELVTSHEALRALQLAWEGEARPGSENASTGQPGALEGVSE